MEAAKVKRTTVDRMTEAEVRSLLKGIVADVRAGVAAESSSEIGDFVIERLEKAGVRTDTSR